MGLRFPDVPASSRVVSITTKWSVSCRACASISSGSGGPRNVFHHQEVAVADRVGVVRDHEIGVMPPGDPADLAMEADPATQNLVNQDLTTNDADANLANGL